ncbi:hypothetical protein PLESTB_000201100 [Pleodorina starrii]|uniref:Uncharacterized protein n=1 Tax=Pleodorina starrii TaxID=330485 RepID=A0A9W6EY08_9CHLO|nr:hypothetical protein PLESTM_000330700 [Pleodorina starrii]GLC49272.1 hypothetical protein PLESTB_000201100 [Pleodorina starrii]GLC73474.1 hypothetical protein PLESTF_001381800 [Pleodorina starrii]
MRYGWLKQGDPAGQREQVERPELRVGREKVMALPWAGDGEGSAAAASAHGSPGTRRGLARRARICWLLSTSRFSGFTAAQDGSGFITTAQDEDDMHPGDAALGVVAGVRSWVSYLLVSYLLVVVHRIYADDSATGSAAALAP